ncbi:hypothetical protein [Pseudomonas sp. CCI3.1]|jgi:hypothetical protein|uniref:hypothetical protein n=1 Tax=Pseudomonas sp. CCI3.1 TaxID=3048618 RepID=UPI002AB48087|nr:MULTISPECIES: hypothetical protein [unclassified Pseudomonas]MDY7585101.1 hypothetical protein [Pseudomonas sp. CCI3.1]MEB0066041.1 hypothetical protein [Pseudomonas sp. CCI3.1]MEB0074605.1 hypothetical protein [Pseudomonas sp. CCI1.4]
MNNLKSTLAQIDDELLAELLEAAQFALNDTRTAKRLSAELDIPVARIKALAYTAVQLSMEPGAVPDISTVAQLDAFQEELTGLGKLN